MALSRAPPQRGNGNCRRRSWERREYGGPYSVNHYGIFHISDRYFEGFGDRHRIGTRCLGRDQPARRIRERQRGGKEYGDQAAYGRGRDRPCGHEADPAFVHPVQLRGHAYVKYS